jgi:hypothetical protein
MRVMVCRVVLTCLLVCPAWGDSPVHFADARLKAAVEAALWISDPTAADMLGLTSLVAENSYDRSNAITSLTGLEYATNLTELNLRYHKVSDLSPLSGLTNLRCLALLGNEISDISALRGLVYLESLDLESNEITDLSALTGCPSLRSVCLHRNLVSDLSPLTSLTNLDWLDLRANPLSQDAYSVYLPRIEVNNPGIKILYDGFFVGQLTMSSTAGGSVISPGEGTFDVTFGEWVWIEAKADPCFVFAGWSGAWATPENPILLKVDQDYTMRANFLSVLQTIHVDDDSPADPGPADSAVSDPLENGTAQHPFDRIQEAIEVARDGTTIFVHAGIYRETIDLLGKHVTLTGFDPADPNAAAWPTIDGNDGGPVVGFTHGESSDCRLTGFVLTAGKNRLGGAIYCSRSSPVIANCLIVGNRATEPASAAVYCTGSNASFVNCTIADNFAGSLGAGLYVVDSHVTVLNSILWGNTPRQILSAGSSETSVTYSAVSGGWPGLDNIKADPLFARAGCWTDRNLPGVVVGPDDPDAIWMPGDYHVASEAGRWDANTGLWVRDDVSSPCVDAGDPACAIGAEPAPNGGLINVGAYGGTAQASKSRSGIR